MNTPNSIQPKEEMPQWKTRVEKVMEYVDNHLSEDLRIATVSEKLNLNKFTLRNIFKEHQHETFHAYVERKRMDKALQMLNEGKWVKEIMPETGYRNHSTFNLAFKKRFKYPPRHFRK